jgi:putative oxidoreductase
MNGSVDRKTLIIPGLAGVYEGLAPYSYAFIRFCAGAILMYHGYAKLFAGFAPVVADKVLAPMGFPAPLAWAYWLGILEFFGAGLLAIGFLTRPIALMLAVEMAIVTFVAHFGNGYFFTAPRGGYEYPLLLTLLYVGILFGGGGRYSVDHMIGKEF